MVIVNFGKFESKAVILSLFEKSGVEGKYLPTEFLLSLLTCSEQALLKDLEPTSSKKLGMRDSNKNLPKLSTNKESLILKRKTLRAISSDGLKRLPYKQEVADLISVSPAFKTLLVNKPTSRVLGREP